MSPHSLRSIAVGVLAGGAILAGPVAAASASDASIKTDVAHAAVKLAHAQKKVVTALRHFDAAHPYKLVDATTAEDRILDGLRRQLQNSSASSHNGAVARRDIVAGLKLILESNEKIVHGLRHHDLSGAKAKAAAREAKSGNAKFHRGIELLLHG